MPAFNKIVNVAPYKGRNMRYAARLFVLSKGEKIRQLNGKHD